VTTMKRSVRVWGALALGLGTMGPTLALSLNGAAPAARVGRAVPLAFAVGAVGIILIAYSFAVLARRHSHSGSAYAFVGATLGPRFGAFAGFALLGFYVFSTICVVAGTALFTNSFLQSVHINHVPWVVLALVASAAVAWLCTQDLRQVVRILILLEAIGVILIAVLTVVIFAKVGSGHAPAGQRFSFNAFSLPPHTGLAALGAASVFSWLSWAGFEAIATLGEEAVNPRRHIPRALAACLAITIPLFIVVMWAESIGFGTSKSGAAAFAGSATPLGTLAEAYVGAFASRALLFVAAASSFACLVGCAAASSRMMYAFARSGFGPARFNRLSDRGMPTAAALTLLVVAFAINGIMAADGTTPVNVYFYYATIGVLCLLVAYAMVGVSAATVMLRSRRAALALPAALGSVFACYVFYIQVKGQVSPYIYFPYYAAAWCLFALAIVLARPQLAKRMGETLTSELREAEAARSEAESVIAAPPVT
jgi:amino acid transporter